MITLPVKQTHCWTNTRTDPATGQIEAVLEVKIETDARSAGRCVAGHDSGLLRLVLFESAAELEIVDEMITMTFGEGP
jgi:hypothetical protein